MDMPDKLEQVFERSADVGISLNPEKCVFGVESGVLLGHVVSKDGIAMDEGKIKKISGLPTPENLKQLRGFLGRELLPPLCRKFHTHSLTLNDIVTEG